MAFEWNTGFLQPAFATKPKRALIILNQATSTPLLKRLWSTCEWRCCADGGANRLHDNFIGEDRAQ